MKTMSNFWQNFRASLSATPGRVVFALLENAGEGRGGIRQGGLGQRALLAVA